MSNVKSTLVLFHFCGGAGVQSPWFVHNLVLVFVCSTDGLIAIDPSTHQVLVMSINTSTSTRTMTANPYTRKIAAVNGGLRALPPPSRQQERIATDGGGSIGTNVDDEEKQSTDYAIADLAQQTSHGLRKKLNQSEASSSTPLSFNLPLAQRLPSQTISFG